MLTQQERVKGLPPAAAQRTVQITNALQKGQLDQAERDVIAVLALAPKHPEVLRLYGTVQSLRGHRVEAIGALEQARAVQPNDPYIHNTLGGAYEAVGDYAQALDALARACATGPDLPSCWFNYGRLLFVSGDVPAASKALHNAVRLAPNHADARVMLGNILRAEDRNAEAEAEFRKAIGANPASGQAWWGLATLKPMPLREADIERMRQALTRNVGAEVNLISLGFALANALDHFGRYAEAFATLKTTHERARRRQPWDARAFTTRVDDTLRMFRSVAPTESAQGSEVVFITSMPRSGSTLTEQILASHSQVEGTTELTLLGELISEESDRHRLPFPQWVPRLSGADWLALGARYLERTAQWRRQRPRFVDKMPHNWMFVGAIRAMLPQARVVIVRRDALENCFACWRFLFNHHPYTHDFTDMAAQWRDFDRAASQWGQDYPQHVREQIYERLQADPEGEIRALLEFCDLPFEAACLNFHATERRVTTPSAAQVREPIRRDTARAGKYGALLDPLRSALGLPPFQAS